MLVPKVDNLQSRGSNRQGLLHKGLQEDTDPQSDSPIDTQSDPPTHTQPDTPIDTQPDQTTARFGRSNVRLGVCKDGRADRTPADHAVVEAEFFCNLPRLPDASLCLTQQHATAPQFFVAF